VEAQDYRGALLIAARLVRLVMELGFLQERRYWPYPKWFGTAFDRLQISRTIGPILDSALESDHHGKTESELNSALTILAERHNSLELTPVIPPAVSHFRVGINDAVRPYPVVNAADFCDACREAIVDKSLKELPTVGSIDQLTHSDDLLVNFTSIPRLFEGIYGGNAPE
jgi:hypothetical protein